MALPVPQETESVSHATANPPAGLQRLSFVQRAALQVGTAGKAARQVLICGADHRCNQTRVCCNSVCDWGCSRQRASQLSRSTNSTSSDAKHQATCPALYRVTPCVHHLAETPADCVSQKRSRGCVKSQRSLPHRLILRQGPDVWKGRKEFPEDPRA